MSMWQHPTRNDSTGGIKDRTDPSHRRGVLLINLGTPDSPDVPDVRRYLCEFLSDPSVIQLPRGLHWLHYPLGAFIARFRASSSAEMYRSIWGERGSPLKVITEDLVAALEASLSHGWRVFYAMRYGRPGIVESLRTIEAAGIDELVVIPMYPQFSDPTTGTALRVLYDYLKPGDRPIDVTTRTTWYDDQGYIAAQTKLIQEYLGAHGLKPDDSYLLFSAHGLPVSYVKRGDPYCDHVNRTVALVSGRLGWPVDRMSLSYQSRMGPVKWLEPYTDRVLGELTGASEKRIVVCPISFTADCLETLEEIDLRYRKIVEDGGADLYLCPSLNTYEPFIAALKNLVLRGARPVNDAVAPVRRRETALGNVENVEIVPGDVEPLLMVGVAMEGRLGAGCGPKLQYSDAEALRRVKQSQCRIPALLQELRDHAHVQEGWILNTCHRFEFFGRLDPSLRRGERDHAVERIRERLVGGDRGDDPQVNVLYGDEAWHHLVRTAAGLNSELPGECDVLEQLRASHRLASCAGSTGPWADELIKRVFHSVRQLRESTEWGTTDVDYSFAAVSGIIERDALDLAASRIVVLGGSTTSAAFLRMLTDRYDVPSRQLTLFYRGHRRGGHIKLLRQAIGQGRRVRVQSYAEQRVRVALGEADIIVFGLDRNEPVLTAESISGLRDWVCHPLVIFDFNMFGSTTGLDSLAGVTLYPADRLAKQVTRFADDLCGRQQFVHAVEAAETWIREQAFITPARAGSAGHQESAARGNGKGDRVVGSSPSPRTRHGMQASGMERPHAASMAPESNRS